MSKPACVLEPCQLLGNTDFEFPVIPLSGECTCTTVPGPGGGQPCTYPAATTPTWRGSQFVYQDCVPCWNTTNPSNLIEFWRGAVGPAPYTGSQFVELNSNAVGKLYQNFTAAPGTTITVSFAHAGRTGYPNQMFVQIAEGIASTPQFSTSITAVGFNTWTVHTFTHTLTGSGPNYTLIFNSPSTGGSLDNGGNFLDSVKVTLTPPSVTISTNSPCASPAVMVGSTLTLSSVAVGVGPFSYSWTGPNAFVSNLQKISLASATTQMAGTYNLSVTDGNGCLATAITCVSILSAPCYVIKDCNPDGQPDFITNSDFSQYVGQVVKTCINSVPSFKSSEVVGTDCYTLTNCCDPTEKISFRKWTVNTEPLNWDGWVVTSTLPQLAGRCWRVTEVACDPVPVNVDNSISLSANYPTFTKYTSGSCPECIAANPDFTECIQAVELYDFTNCCTQETIVIGCTNIAYLLPFINQVVTIPSVSALGTTCWTVAKYTGTTGIYTVTVTPANPVTIVAGGCSNTKCVCVENWEDGCYCVTVELAVNCTGANPWIGDLLGAYTTCEECTATCYILTDCAGVEAPITVSNNFSGYVGQIIQLENCNDICWEVSEAPQIANCCYDISTSIASSRTIIINGITYTIPTPGNAINYLNSLNLGTWSASNVSPELNRLCVTGEETYGTYSTVINQISSQVQPTCTYTANCDNSVCVPPVSMSFTTCLECNPPPVPVAPTLNIRRVKPGYNTPGCDPQYTELVSCSFSEAMFDEMARLRYGITVCCDEDIDYWDVKKQLLDLKAILDPNPQLLDIPCTCFTITQLTGRNTYSYVSCAGVLTNITLNAGDVYYPCTKLRPCVTNCDNVGTYTLASSESECATDGDCVPVPPLCYCWEINSNGPCLYSYVDCLGNARQITVTQRENYICSRTEPTGDPLCKLPQSVTNLGLCADIALCNT
jgi:hypothetical protein